ncbi:MAG: hypothetical protein QNJ09_09875 [Paracoccaceae bacterium]|nr:hypothetical protein [Paracoccaceae bacterium]
MIRVTIACLVSVTLGLTSACTDYVAFQALTFTEQTGAVLSEAEECVAGDPTAESQLADLRRQTNTLTRNIRSTNERLETNAQEIADTDEAIETQRELLENLGFAGSNYMANLGGLAILQWEATERGGDGYWPFLHTTAAPPPTPEADAINQYIEIQGYTSFGSFLLLAVPASLIALGGAIGALLGRASQLDEIREMQVRVVNDMVGELTEIRALYPDDSYVQNWTGDALEELQDFLDDPSEGFGYRTLDRLPYWSDLFRARDNIASLYNTEATELQRLEGELDELRDTASELLQQQDDQVNEAADLRDEAIAFFEEVCNVRVIRTPTYSNSLWWTSSP